MLPHNTDLTGTKNDFGVLASSLSEVEQQEFLNILVGELLTNLHCIENYLDFDIRQIINDLPRNTDSIEYYKPKFDRRCYTIPFAASANMYAEIAMDIFRKVIIRMRKYGYLEASRCIFDYCWNLSNDHLKQRLIPLKITYPTPKSIIEIMKESGSGSNP